MRKPSRDCRERMTMALAVGMEMYRAITGSLLSIFVPQTCAGVQNGTDACSVSTLARMEDETTPLRLTTTTLNWATLAAFLLLYTVETRRENFCVEWFDVDPSMPDDNLVRDENTMPAVLRKTLDKWNRLYRTAVKFTTAAVVSNVAMSAFYVSDRSTAGTVSSLVSFTLLLVLKLVASNSVTSDRTGVRSAYLSEHTSFNVIDADKRDQFVGQERKNAV